MIVDPVRFMWTLHTANEEHWVPLATVSSFKRMREFSSLGDEWLAEQLKSSASVEVDETKTKVRRKTEVTEPKGQFERSIYAVRIVADMVEAFPDSPAIICRKVSARKLPDCNKSSRHTSTSMAGRARCACGVWMTRSCSRCAARYPHAPGPSNLPQGSVFVEFDDMSSVESFLNADPKPTWEGKELLIMSK